MPTLLIHSAFSYYHFSMPVSGAPPAPRLRYFPPISSQSPPSQHSLTAASDSQALTSANARGRHICHYVPLKSLLEFTLCLRKQKSRLTSPILSMNRGSSTSSQEGLCKIVWIVEAELKDDQLLYVTGDITDLGCWNTEMAILMEPTGDTNIWKAEAEVASGISLKYNYFMKKEVSACDIVWRPGPQFSVSVSVPCAENRDILVKDMWTRPSMKLPASRLWSLWMDDLYYPAQSLASTSTSDALENATCLERKLRGTKPVINGFSLKAFSIPIVEDTVRDLLEDMDDDKSFSERNQPVEEPWLYSSFSNFHKSNVDDQASKGEVSVKDDSIELDVHTDQQLTQMMLPEDEYKLVSHENPVSTVILINSSICTMQRIAVMEDGRLVELLLEPVKSDVQSESVYLGVVMKHVPHMGGAFVDIGISRPSLMDIKNNREPYIFPPFRHATEDKAENSEMESTILNDIPVTNEIAMSGFQDDQTHFVHDDYDEHEIDDEYDIPEVVKEITNGTISGDVDSECAGHTNGLEETLEVNGANALVPSKVNGPDNPKPDLRETQDIKSKSTTVNMWSQVQKGTKIIVQVVKEGLGTKGPTLTAYPKLRSRFWILHCRCDRIGVSKKISGIERTRLKVIAKTLQPKGFGLTVRTVAAGHSLEELQKDLEGLVCTWKSIMEHAKSAALAADEGVDGAVPMMLHKAMGQTLSVVQDYFNDKVERLVLDSPRTYHEVTNYLQDIAPDLCDRVELYDKRVPLFDEFKIEEEMNNILSKRVPLVNGGSLVIEQTEALVSIDVNGGHGMLGHGTSSQEKAILEVNLAAAKQIARELRLRDIGGIIVIDFIDMEDEAHKRLVYEEVKKAVEKDRSMVKVSELSRHGLMEITRKRVRPSVTFMISEPCACCHATGRVEALETSFAKIEQEICRQLASKKHTVGSGNPKSWPKFMLMVDRFMCNYLTSGKRTRLAVLSSSLKVWILLKVARGFTRGAFEVKSLPDDDNTSSKPPPQVPIPILRQTEGRPHSPNRKVTLIPVKKWKALKK